MCFYGPPPSIPPADRIPDPATEDERDERDALDAGEVPPPRPRPHEAVPQLAV